MTNQEIETLFFTVIQEKAIYNKLEGISRNTVFNWLKKRQKQPTIGDMLNVLHQLNKIDIVLKDVVKPMAKRYKTEQFTEFKSHTDALTNNEFGGIPSELEKKVFNAIFPKK